MSGPQTFVIPVGTGVTVGTGITTYSGLVTSVGTWLDRSDLGTLVPDFITLVEERANRLLRVPDMEEVESLSTTADDETVTLPTDFLQLKELHFVSSSTVYELQQLSLPKLRHTYDYQATTGKPVDYAIAGDQLYLGPVPDATYSLQLTYWQKITALSSDNETNWLITNHPSYYLYGCLVMAELYGWNDERLPMIKSAWDEVIVEIQDHGKRKRFGGQRRMMSDMANRQTYNITTDQ